MGFITGTADSLTTAVDLTAAGIADWIHWNAVSTNVRKTGVTAQISTYTRTDAAGDATNLYSSDPRTISWSDGTPTASGSDTSGLFVNSSSTLNGFQITAPASPRIRILTCNFGYFNCSATLTASLSDASATNFTDTAPTVGASSTDRNYVIRYASSSGGATLTVTWVGAVTGGNCTINGASLVIGPSPLSLLGVGS